MEKTHFQNGIQFVWDSTSLSLLKTCPMKYKLAMIDDLVSKGKSIHLEFGILAHSARELYYKKRVLENLDHEDGLRAAIKWAAVAAKNLPPDTRKTPYHLLLFLVTYLDFYENDPCETYILPSGGPAVELSFKLDIGSYMLAGHIDRVVRFNGKIFLTDLKTTTTSLGEDYFRQYTPNNQLSLYDFAGSHILPEEDKPAGIIVDAVQILSNGIRCERRIITRTNSQREEWLSDFFRWMEVNKYYHENCNSYPMNDTACNQYGRCVFRDQHCSLIPSLRRSALETYFEKKIWNPLDNR